MRLDIPRCTADRCLLRGRNPSTSLRKGCASRFLSIATAESGLKRQRNCQSKCESRSIPERSLVPMAWIYLFVAGVFESAWAIGLKYSAGFTKLGPSIFTIVAMMISIYLLALALRTLPVGTGYAVWTGIGTVGAAILGIFLFNESREIARILCILLIVAGIIGLKLTSSE